MDSHVASYGSCFMVNWTIFKSHLVEVGLTQNRETTTLRNLTTIDLLHFIMCEDAAWIEIHESNIWLRAWSHMTSHYTWGPMMVIDLEESLRIFVFVEGYIRYYFIPYVLLKLDIYILSSYYQWWFLTTCPGTCS
jgi:hypothetical protein